MELNKNLEYKICFDKVENLDGYKRKSDFYGSVKVENYLYAITIEGDKRKLAEKILPEIISEFKKLYYAGRIKNGLVIEQTRSHTSNLSEN